ncbi:MAG: hypothetical protein EBV31_05040 [Verrucomicrobia bacterium]|nr:hypothetical protein [Verrucomicrobiota bacterium]
MSASAAVLSLLQAAQGKGQISASSLANAGDWLRSGALPAAALDSLKDLCDRGAWAEIEDRFYKGIAFGTGGMRGRTVGRVSAANEVDAQGLLERARRRSLPLRRRAFDAAAELHGPSSRRPRRRGDHREP